MIDLLRLLALGGYAAWLCVWLAVVAPAWWLNRPGVPPMARAAYRTTCWPGIASVTFVFATGVPDPLAPWLAAPALLALLWAWSTGHRLVCRDSHGRRLRDAATGLVRRVGARLRVQPIPAGTR